MTETIPGAASRPRRAAVLGSPIAHSLSPALHRAAYAELALPWRYDAIECDEAGLAGFLAGLDDSFVGLSLTMPLKRAVLPLLDDVSPLASAVGAVNTVTFDWAAGVTRGDNTDVAGLVASIASSGVRLGNAARAVLLGAGGTAAGALAALRDLGLGQAEAVVRDKSRAGELLAASDRLGMRVELVQWPGLDAVAGADLIISTVPAGAADPVAAAWSPRPAQLLFDVLYEPWPTRLATRAREGGAAVVGGLELLVQQAAGQLQRWSGRHAPTEVMRAAGAAVLRARERSA